MDMEALGRKLDHEEDKISISLILLHVVWYDNSNNPLRRIAVLVFCIIFCIW